MASVDLRRAVGGCDGGVARGRIITALVILIQNTHHASRITQRRVFDVGRTEGDEGVDYVRATGGMMLENSRVGMRAPPRSI
jgi:hypothetical protein